MTIIKNKIIKLLSCFILPKSQRREFRAKYMSSIIKNKGKNNKLIIVDELENEVDIKYINNLEIKFCGDNNLCKIYYKFRTNKKTTISLHQNATLEIGASPHVINITVPGWIADGCKLHIGKNVSIADAVFLILDEKNVSISIKDNCMLSTGITFRSSDTHIIVDSQTNQRINFAENIIVGEHTWLGMGTTILKGSHIPPNSIVGAKSVYTKSCNPKNLSNWDGGIFVGQPAKLKKIGINWYRDQKEYDDSLSITNTANICNSIC